MLYESHPKGTDFLPKFEVTKNQLSDIKYNSRNLYTYLVGFGPSFNADFEEPDIHPYIDRVRGRANSRGIVGDGKWAILCCGYNQFDCPDPTGSPLDPF